LESHGKANHRGLLGEPELAKPTKMLAALRDHLGIGAEVDEKIEATLNDMAPEAVLKALTTQGESALGPS
jgi:hypothetical protein